MGTLPDWSCFASSHVYNTTTYNTATLKCFVVAACHVLQSDTEL